MNIFLDDWRVPIDCAKYMYRRSVDCRIYHQPWVIVRTYGDFVRKVNEQLPTMVSLDYDLADDNQVLEQSPLNDWFNNNENRVYTGLDCLIYLLNKTTNVEIFYHTTNPSGLILLRDYERKIRENL